jgi:hypothetical protein
MGIENINQAAVAMNELTARMNSFFGDADDQIAQSQAAYAALAANLKNVVNSQMFFFGTVDPDEENPTNIRGGTFTTIKNLLAYAPAGSSVQMNLLPGKTYDVTERVTIRGQHILFNKLGVGDPPIISFKAFASGGFNTVASLMPTGPSSLKFYKCNVELPTAKADENLPWSSFTGLLGYDVAMPQAVGFQDCFVSGGVVGEQIGIITSSPAVHAMLGIFSTTFDGPLFGVVNGISSTASISLASATLLNGAKLIGDDSTLGVNYLKS